MSHSKLPRIIVTAGEPAGIGADLCCLLANFEFKAELVILGDANMLQDRADLLNLDIQIQLFENDRGDFRHQTGVLKVWHQPCNQYVEAGVLNTANAAYVLQMLERAALATLSGRFDALVTAPVHKAVINQAGVKFTGHTEFFGDLCREKTGKATPVMMLANDKMRVALATTHLPLSKVSKAISAEVLQEVIRVVHHDLRHKFGIHKPRIGVCGLNPHAGEGGHLGREELRIINPCMEQLRERGINVSDAMPADTIFTTANLAKFDVILAMYHDQGLPVLKYSGFGSAVNITLGLPIIRTSVDHGTALDLAGTGNISSGSIKAAVDSAILISRAQSAGN